MSYPNATAVRVVGNILMAGCLALAVYAACMSFRDGMRLWTFNNAPHQQCTTQCDWED
jgi:hypothetical protein